MLVNIKHAGRKADVMEQPTGIVTASLYDKNGNFLRTRSFPNMDHALDFATQWLYDMESQDSGEIVDLLHRWEKSGLMAAGC